MNWYKVIIFLTNDIFEAEIKGRTIEEAMRNAHYPWEHPTLYYIISTD